MSSTHREWQNFDLTPELTVWFNAYNQKCLGLFLLSVAHQALWKQECSGVSINLLLTFFQEVIRVVFHETDFSSFLFEKNRLKYIERLVSKKKRKCVCLLLIWIKKSTHHSVEFKCLNLRCSIPKCLWNKRWVKLRQTQQW